MGFASKLGHEYEDWLDNREGLGFGRAPVCAYAQAGGGSGSSKHKITGPEMLQRSNKVVTYQNKNILWSGRKLVGTVREVVPGRGAFVVVDPYGEGLLRKYELLPSYRGNIPPVGTKITVWVKEVDEEDRIILSMKEPAKLKYSDLKVNDILEGVVSHIESDKCFVDIGLERVALLPISEISHRWLDSVNDILAIGDEIKVKVIKLEPQEKRVILSIKKLSDVYRKHQQQARRRRNYSNWH